MKGRTIRIHYGTRWLKFTIPEENLVPGNFRSERGEILSNLEKIFAAPIGMEPLPKYLKKAKRILLVCDDYTRPTPINKILPRLLSFFHNHGVSDDQLTLLVAAGYHREMTEEEKIKKYGQEAVRRLKIVHHYADDKEMLIKLKINRHDLTVSINRLAVESDFIIGIGVVEIHPWAGFAGGTKIIVPGIAGKETIDNSHALPVIGENSDIAQTKGNSFWEFSSQVVSILPPLMIINVVLNENEKIIQVFAGEPIQAQQEAINYFRCVNEIFWDEPLDVIITSSNPKYQHWGQAIIAGYNVNRVVKKGGLRIVAGACPEGLGDSPFEKNFYYESLKNRWNSLDDYWQKMKGKNNQNSRNACAVYRYLESLKHSDLIMVTDGFSKDRDELQSLRRMSDIDKAIAVAFKKYGKRARIGVLDMGGMLLPSIKEKTR